MDAQWYLLQPMSPCCSVDPAITLAESCVSHTAPSVGHAVFSTSALYLHCVVMGQR